MYAGTCYLQSLFNQVCLLACSIKPPPSFLHSLFLVFKSLIINFLLIYVSYLLSAHTGYNVANTNNPFLMVCKSIVTTCASHRPVCAWFHYFFLIHEVSKCACVCVCECVPMPKLLINSAVI